MEHIQYISPIIAEARHHNKVQINQSQALPKPEEFESRDNMEYKIKAIIDSTIYSQQANNLIPGFNSLILWKSYPVKEITREPILAIIPFQKLISTFYKEHPKKPTISSSSLNSVLLITRLIIPKIL